VTLQKQLEDAQPVDLSALQEKKTACQSAQLFIGSCSKDSL